MDREDNFSEKRERASCKINFFDKLFAFVFLSRINVSSRVPDFPGSTNNGCFSTTFVFPNTLRWAHYPCSARFGALGGSSEREVEVWKVAEFGWPSFSVVSSGLPEPACLLPTHYHSTTVCGMPAAGGDGDDATLNSREGNKLKIKNPTSFSKLRKTFHPGGCV